MNGEGRELLALRAENDRLNASRDEWTATAVQRGLELEEAHAENGRLREALNFLMKTRWKSVDKDNMEFEGRVTCYQLDQARAALKDAPQ